MLFDPSEGTLIFMNPESGSPQRIVFFDGVCHLCNGFVDLVMTRDKNRHLAFAPLQGTTAATLLASKDLQSLDTVIYYENGILYKKSSAVLKILSTLPGLHKLWTALFVIPRPLRDLIYNYVAQRRYSWFGERQFCRFPLPEEKSSLLP